MWATIIHNLVVWVLLPLTSTSSTMFCRTTSISRRSWRGPIPTTSSLIPNISQLPYLTTWAALGIITHCHQLSPGNACLPNQYLVNIIVIVREIMKLYSPYIPLRGNHPSSNLPMGATRPTFQAIPPPPLLYLVFNHQQTILSCRSMSSWCWTTSTNSRISRCKTKTTSYFV